MVVQRVERQQELRDVQHNTARVCYTSAAIAAVCTIISSSIDSNQDAHRMACLKFWRLFAEAPMLYEPVLSCLQPYDILSLVRANITTIKNAQLREYADLLDFAFPNQRWLKNFTISNHNQFVIVGDFLNNIHQYDCFIKMAVARHTNIVILVRGPALKPVSPHYRLGLPSKFTPINVYDMHNLLVGTDESSGRGTGTNINIPSLISPHASTSYYRARLGSDTGSYSIVYRCFPKLTVTMVGWGGTIMSASPLRGHLIVPMPWTSYEQILSYPNTVVTSDESPHGAIIRTVAMFGVTINSLKPLLTIRDGRLCCRNLRQYYPCPTQSHNLAYVDESNAIHFGVVSGVETHSRALFDFVLDL